MDRHQQNQETLVFKRVSDLQTNLGLPCCPCRCRCRCCISMRNHADVCLSCYTGANFYRCCQQTRKTKSVFDYFYEQLYSDNRQKGGEYNSHCNPSSGVCSSVYAEPICTQTGVPHAFLDQANSWKFRNEKEKSGSCMETCSEKLVFRKECNSFIKPEFEHDRKEQCDRCQRQQNNAAPSLGISLGYFEVYLAQETSLHEEDVEKRKSFLNEAHPNRVNVRSNVCDNVNNPRKEGRKAEGFTRKRHSRQRYGRGKHSLRVRNLRMVPESSTSFISPTRRIGCCTSLKVEGCVSQTTKEPAHQRTTLAHTRCTSKSRPWTRSTSRSRTRSTSRSKTWSTSRSRTRSTIRPRSRSTTRSRSRSASQTRSVSHNSSKRFARSSTVSSKTCRSSDFESCSRSRSPCHHSVSRSPSRSTSKSPSRSTSKSPSRSLSRGVSRSTSQAVISAASDRNVRSPSIRRRTGSPCHLDKRRITSARRRPMAYRRAVSPSSPSSSGSSSSSRSSRISMSGSDSATSSRSRSFVSSTNYHGSTKPVGSVLYNRRQKRAQQSKYSPTNVHSSQSIAPQTRTSI